MATVLYAIPGAGIGALVGLFVRGEERWEQVQRERIRISLERGNMWGPALRLSF